MSAIPGPHPFLLRDPRVRGEYVRGSSRIFQGDALRLCGGWSTPTCIVVDGPYGVSGFPGDPPTAEGLAEWYRPHIEAWSRLSTPQTTLWFWNTELGWATVHPVLLANGWEYRSCHIWNKGIGHIAGNANSLTLRKFPVVSEVCVQYVRPARFEIDEHSMSMKEWLRHEWMRSGLPMYMANKACGVKNAATRKYLTACHLWYFPPVEMFEAMAAYVNKHGDAKGRPYFSRDRKRSISGREWAKLRAKFQCDIGITNVWDEPQVRGDERLKNGTKVLHLNQKPLRLMELVIRASTESGDVVWEPFGGLCTAAVAAHNLGRQSYSAEITPEVYESAVRRFKALP